MKRRHVKIIGIWLNHVVIYPHPRQLTRSDLTAIDREAVAKYIESCAPGSFVSQVPMIEEDCLISSQQQFEFDLRSDGKWIFPISLSYYVRQGVSLPAEFVSDAIEMRSAPCEKIRQEHCVINEFYWVFWSVTHSLWNRYFVLFILRLGVSFPLYLLIFFIRMWFRRYSW